MKYEICTVIKGGFISIDQHQTFATIIVEQTSCRIDGQASAAYDEQIRRSNGSDALFNGFAVQAFFIKYHIRFYNATALTAGYAVTLLDKLSAVEFSTTGAIVTKNRAMKFANIFRASQLV